METYLIVLALATMPALGNFAGGVFAEIINPSARTLSLALHAAAGVVIAVVAIELMPRALEASPQWLIVASFVAGGGFFVLMRQAIEWLGSRSDQSSDATGPWVIWFGVAVDLFSDGVLVGTGATITTGLALLLALGQVTADIPEGFVSIADFRRNGIERNKRLLLSLAFALPVLGGATLGYWAMRDARELYQLMLLTFTAGVLTTLAVEELVPESHAEMQEAVPEGKLPALTFVAAFALFALISAYLG